MSPYAKGEKVKEGQILGKVGNSGNTSDPHLHIHAEKDGKGVAITFNDRFLVRNSLVRYYKLISFSCYYDNRNCHSNNLKE
ncbi:M23 family metallopeptidase [Lysinibacillus agricola]|uniref:M23 family metallopeptidase n=1 Tax=Lysinibacillus agricola TaxID=2590012 RepID=UPI003CCCFBE6